MRAKAETVENLIARGRADVDYCADEIQYQGDRPEWNIVVMGNSTGKIFTTNWLEDAEGNALDMIRGLADLVDAIDEDQSYQNGEVKRGEIIGAMIGCLEAIRENPEVVFTDVVDMEADF